MDNSFKISVIIPTYNSVEFIVKAINSALKQSFKPFEIIVVDDASTDGTTEIVRQTFNNKVMLVENCENLGASSARNKGIMAASGSWIAFLDSDDEWMENHLESLVSIVAKYSLQWCCGQHQNVKHGEVIQRPHKKWKRFHKQDTFFENFFQAWAYDPPFITSGILANKNLIFEAGMFDSSLAVAEDIDLWLKIAHIIPKVGLTDFPTLKHHIRNDSLCATHEKRSKLLLNLLEKHLSIASEAGVNSLINFTPSAKKIVKWVIHYAILEKDTGVLKKVLQQYIGFIEKNTFILKCLLSIPGGVQIYSRIYPINARIRSFVKILPLRLNCK